jgi:hypothetical protein
LSSPPALDEGKPVAVSAAMLAAAERALAATLEQTRGNRTAA